jgi:hypothetical protein
MKVTPGKNTQWIYRPFFHCGENIMRALNILKDDHYDFTAKYLAVNELNECAKTNPECISKELISSLREIFRNPAVTRQSQSYFLLKEAAEILCRAITRFRGSLLPAQAYGSVMDLLKSTHGSAHRAVSEALGSRPLPIHGPDVRFETEGELPRPGFKEILEKWGALFETARILGRSLVFERKGEEDVFVLKTTGSHESVESMFREAAWMEHLGSEDYAFPVRFDVPKGVTVGGRPVFILSDLPRGLVPGEAQREHMAIAFLTNREYYSYPNHYKSERRLDGEKFMEVMNRNAWLFGKLSSLGIVHTAPIPLFHNRIQRHRREDHGRYWWERGGRLDRWLFSCCYPNFGLTGIRDFEHLVSLDGSDRNLYRYVGTHLLSLVLVIGSYFRNHDAGRVGLTAEGNPVVARVHVDRGFFMELLQGVFSSYYQGFVGTPFPGETPLDFEKLTGRMIEEMGVDRRMEEILRAADQEEMSDEEFLSFLRENGYAAAECKAQLKGAGDLVLRTGPHLGGFNQGISVPECTEAVASMSALCIFGAYEALQGAEQET